MRKTLLALAALVPAMLFSVPAWAESKVLGAWDTAIEVGGGQQVFLATLTFTEGADGYALDFKDADPGAAALKPQIISLDVTDDGFTFRRTLDMSAMGGEVVEITYTGQVAGDELTGDVTSVFGPATMRATRLPTEGQ